MMLSGRIETVNIRSGDSVSAMNILVELNGSDENEKITTLNHLLLKQEESLVARHNAQRSERELLLLEAVTFSKTKENIRQQVAEIESQYNQKKQILTMLNSVNSVVKKLDYKRENLQLSEIKERLLIRKQELNDVLLHQRLLNEKIEQLSARFEQERINHETQITSLEADIVELQQRLKHKSIYTPITATVAQLMPLQKGQWINAGEKLATLFPDAPLRVVAQFELEDSHGYLRAGQQAKIQLDNFPWLQYGVLYAEVIHIDKSDVDGKVRVILSIKKESTDSLIGTWNESAGYCFC